MVEAGATYVELEAAEELAPTVTVTYSVAVEVMVAREAAQVPAAVEPSVAAAESLEPEAATGSTVTVTTSSSAAIELVAVALTVTVVLE